MASSALLAACKQEKENKDGRGEPPKGKMTMRVNPNTGDKVSLLGYGMMRLPMEGGADMKANQDAPIDQEMVNRQVDYAIEHGVNYFDTSPAYCRGLSEKATGIALSRHKRSEYFIATKMSNFSPEARNIRELAQGVAGGLHRLPLATCYRRRQRCSGDVQHAIHGQRHPRLARGTEEERTHTQPRFLISRRRIHLRHAAEMARRGTLPLGLRADRTELSRLELRRRDKPK